VIIVTGGNIGIGYETAKALLAKNAKVYLACRSKEKADDAIEKLKQETGKEALFLQLDLADISGVRKSAAEFKTKESELHVLFNSAGVMVPPIELTTKDNLDLQFGTNVVGHWLLTMELLPLLEAGAKSSPDGKSRVVTTASMAAELTGGIKWDTLEDGPVRKKYGTQNLYFQSKFGNVVTTVEFARRYGDKGVVFTSLNPGNIQSGLQRHLPLVQLMFIKLMLYPTPFGALTQLYAGTSPETVNMNGKYFVPWARPRDNLAKHENKETGEKLWKWLEEKTNSVAKE